MDERIHVVGNVVVDDQGDAVNVNASCGNVGGDDGFDFAFLERVEDALPLVLTQVAVKPCNVKSVFLEAFNRQVNHALRVAENDGLVVRLHANQQSPQDPEFVRPTNANGIEVNGRDVQFFSVGQDKIRFVHEFMSGVNDFLGKGGGEQQGLFTSSHPLDDPHDVREEPHVKHPVGFVKAEELGGCEVDVTSLAHVHHATGRPNNHVHAFGEAFRLLFQIGSTVNGLDAEPSVALKEQEFLCDLVGQFSGWCKDQCLQ